MINKERDRSGVVVVDRLNKKALVVRDNNLIQGHIRMTPREMKLFLWLVSQVRTDDKVLNKYRISIKMFKNMLGLGGKDLYSNAVDITKQLLSRVVSIHDTKSNEVRQWTLVIGAAHIYGHGYIELQLHPDLHPYVLNLKKNFTSIELEVAMRLPTYYSLRLYEIAKSMRYRGRTFEIAVGSLRGMLGVSDDEYREFKYFNKRVLAPACREVNAATDIRLSYKTCRSGRFVDRIAFQISEGAAAKSPAPPPSSAHDFELFGELRRFGMSDAEARTTIERWASDKGRVTWHVGEVKRLMGTGKIRKPLAWLRAALKTDYRKQKRSPTDAEARLFEAELRSRRPTSNATGVKSISELVRSIRHQS